MEIKRRAGVADELSLTLEQHAGVLSLRAAEDVEMGTLVATNPPPLPTQKTERKIVRRGSGNFIPLDSGDSEKDLKSVNP